MTESTERGRDAPETDGRDVDLDSDRDDGELEIPDPAEDRDDTRSDATESPPHELPDDDPTPESEPREEDTSDAAETEVRDLIKYSDLGTAEVVTQDLTEYHGHGATISATGDEPAVFWPGLLKLSAILIGIVLLIYLAVWSQSWYRDSVRQAQLDADPSLRTEAETATAWATESDSGSEPRSCLEQLEAASRSAGVHRDGDFLFVVPDSGEVTQVWYVGAGDGRLARGRLSGALVEIRCYQDWRLPTVAELQALARRLPPETPELPEGLWTAEDDGIGTEWKVYFPASDDFDLFGGAYTWWLAAVTDAPDASEAEP